jgi:prepilin-type N-terminal cleavage/methylation domain-containing protein
MRRRGFTLIELVVGLGLTSLVLAALAVAVPTALRARDAAAAALARLTAARGVLAAVERELATALPAPVVVAATPPRLAFTGGAEPGEAIAYTLERDALVRRAAPRLALRPETALAVRLLDGVSALEVTTFDGHAWSAAWASDVLPVAVRVRLTFTDGESLETLAPIPTARPRRGA